MGGVRIGSHDLGIIPRLSREGLGLDTQYYPIMENQMENNMENEMETLGPFKGVYRGIGRTAKRAWRFWRPVGLEVNRRSHCGGLNTYTFLRGLRYQAPYTIFMQGIYRTMILETAQASSLQCTTHPHQKPTAITS